MSQIVDIFAADFCKQDSVESYDVSIMKGENGKSLSMQLIETSRRKLALISTISQRLEERYTQVSHNICFKTRHIIYVHTYSYLIYSLSLESRYKQPEESSTDAEKQSRSAGDCITAFLLLSNKPMRRSITITCPILVFSSLTVFISNHLGRS